MKRFLLIAGSAALLMTSCSEEKFLNESGIPDPNNATKGAIEFKASQPNQSRAALEDYTNNFGVFGIKADLATDAPQLPVMPDLKDFGHDYTNEQLVFNNYLVGHYQTYPLNTNQTGGFTETGGTQTTPFSSNWYYEGLGKGEYTTPTGAKESAWANQYLKYWDGGKTFTYFVAYTPYDNTTSAPTLVKAPTTDTEHFLYMKCKAITLEDEKPFMVAARQELNADHTKNPQTTVPLTFKRYQSQVRIAFYEAIKGYDVKMESIDYEDKDGVTHHYGVTAMPYNKNGVDDDGNPTKWGKLITAATPTIKIQNPTKKDESEDLGISFEYDDETTTKTTTVFNFPVDAVYKNSPDPTIGTLTLTLPEIRADKAFSPKVYNVFPQETGNDDLQFVLTFTLVAKDTGETITVHNARVTVPKDYTAWKANCLYTYIFKITKDTNGTTSTPGIGDDPTIPSDPTPELALYPIVFDQLTVEEMKADGNTSEYTLYDANNPTATEDLDRMFILTSDSTDPADPDRPGKDESAEVIFGQKLDLATLMVDKYKTLLQDARTELANDNSYVFPFTFSVKEEDKQYITVDPEGYVTALAPNDENTTTVYVKYGEIRDAVKVSVKVDNKFLTNSKWEVKVNAPYSLASMLAAGKDIAKVQQWYIYDQTSKEYKNLNEFSTDEFVYDSDNNSIKFVVPGKTYKFKADYIDGDDKFTDFFFVNVRDNSFLTAYKLPLDKDTSKDLNSLLQSGIHANKVTWYVGSTELVDPLPTGTYKFTYAEDDSKKELTFTEDGSYIIKAIYDNGNPEKPTEYIAVTVTTPAEP